MQKLYIFGPLNVLVNDLDYATILEFRYMKYSADPRFWDEASKLAKGIDPKVETEESKFRRGTGQ